MTPTATTVDKKISVAFVCLGNMYASNNFSRLVQDFSVLTFTVVVPQWQKPFLNIRYTN